MKRSLAALTLFVALVAAATATATAATIPPITPIPNLPTPKADETARFKVTVRGSQADRTSFFRAPIVDGCSRHLEGTLEENWRFERKSSFILEFRKIAKRIFVQRANRGFGDAAFETKGQLTRNATGFHKIMLPGECLTYPLPSPTCGVEHKATVDMAFGYSSGKLTLQTSGPGKGKANPAEKCGVAPDGHNFNAMSFYFPALAKQKGDLSKSEIFDEDNRKFTVDLKDHALPAIPTEELTTLNERIGGIAFADFKRVK